MNKELEVRVSEMYKEGFFKTNAKEFDLCIYKKLERYVYKGYPLNIFLGFKKLQTLENENILNLACLLSVAFDQATLVIGLLELKDENNEKIHLSSAWVETKDFVYNPVFNLKFDKNFYYTFFNVNYEKEIKSFLLRDIVSKCLIVEKKHMKYDYDNKISKVLVVKCIELLSFEVNKSEKITNKPDFFLRYLLKYCQSLI